MLKGNPNKGIQHGFSGKPPPSWLKEEAKRATSHKKIQKLYGGLGKEKVKNKTKEHEKYVKELREKRKKK